LHKFEKLKKDNQLTNSSLGINKSKNKNKIK
jgi:hypothetical protein